MIKASIDLFCTRHVCIQKRTCARPQKELVGQPLALGCIPSIACFCNTHTCLCAHSSNWSAKVVECSEPALDFFIGLFCHLCVHSRNWSANPQLTSSATHVCVCSQQQSVCQSFEIDQAGIDLYCTGHVCIQKHTSVCPWSARDPWGLSSLDLFLQNTCVCSQQQLVCQSC